MTKISEVAVERRAAALAEKDDYTWQMDYVEPDARYAKLKRLAVLTEKRRRQYLAIARAELNKEAGHA